MTDSSYQWLRNLPGRQLHYDTNREYCHSYQMKWPVRHNSSGCRSDFLLHHSRHQSSCSCCHRQNDNLYWCRPYHLPHSAMLGYLYCHYNRGCQDLHYKKFLQKEKSGTSFLLPGHGRHTYTLYRHPILPHLSKTPGGHCHTCSKANDWLYTHYQRGDIHP